MRDQLSFFDNDKFGSNKPIRQYKITGFDRFDNPETRTVEAVSAKQAVFFFKREVGFQFAYGITVDEVH
jgi:hypothetical protein